MSSVKYLHITWKRGGVIYKRKDQVVQIKLGLLHRKIIETTLHLVCKLCFSLTKVKLTWSTRHHLDTNNTTRQTGRYFINKIIAIKCQYFQFQEIDPTNNDNFLQVPTVSHSKGGSFGRMYENKTIKGV